MQTDIKKNINNVLNSINSSCQQANINANKVSLIAVSKRKSIENIQNAMDIGIKNFGENYAQELNEKNKLINSDIISWHFIGPLQSNKVKLIADSASWIHTLDREKIIVKLNEACNTFNKTINGSFKSIYLRKKQKMVVIQIKCYILLIWLSLQVI